MEAINLDQVLRLRRAREKELRELARCQQVDGLGAVSTCWVGGLLLPVNAAQQRD